MTPEERDRHIATIFVNDQKVLRRKGADYSGSVDALSNLRGFGVLGVIIRMADKMARLQHYAKSHEFKVEDEGVRDTLMDIRNYAFLAQVLLDEEETTKPEGFFHE